MHVWQKQFHHFLFGRKSGSAASGTADDKVGKSATEPRWRDCPDRRTKGSGGPSRSELIHLASNCSHYDLVLRSPSVSDTER